MLTSGKNKKPLQALLGIVSIALSLLGLSTSSIALAQTDTTTPTTINISDTVKTANTQRLGINLGSQDFWDSGMIMRNLAFRNPGFEAETWQTILHCHTVTATSCTDDNEYNYWPANFLNGATASFIVGPAAGTTATITSSTAATIGVVGVTIQLQGLSVAPSVGDYVVARMNVPGNAAAGWWYQLNGGATLATDTTDLSPETPGKQALALNASGAGQHAVLSNFDDGTAGKVFIQLKGNYTVSFRAKGTGGSNQMTIGGLRTAAPLVQLFSQTVNLTNTWQDYSFTFPITNDVNSPGTIALSFDVYQSSMLIDDVAFTEAASATNPTVYRDSVVDALRTLHPGTLRYMDSGINWGSSFDNLLVPDFARLRAGYKDSNSEADDIAMGLHDFLVLCQTVGADPWFTMSAGMTTQEMSNIMDYFGGSTSTVYGAKRAALGQSAPWTSVFGQIHLEFGNEVWNTANSGETMADAASYGLRAAVIFGVAKKSPSYSAKSFDLVINGFEAVPYWTQTALSNSSNYDTVDTATYNFGGLNDVSSTEAIFGPMFAEPEFMNSASGNTSQESVIAATAGPTPAKLAVYETNMGTIGGTATQAQVQAVVPSIGAGLAVAVNMLIGQRDLGITTQNMFALEGYETSFTASSSGLTDVATTTPIWGAAVDMGGPTNLRRPMYLSEALANTAILPSLLSTTQAGLNPTWNQAYTTNDGFSFPGAHYIQSFAYTDGTTLNLVLFNLSRTSALPVNFAGLNTPLGTASVSTLTAASINASNEIQQNVSVASTTKSLTSGGVLSLPPFSMTVLSLPKPVVPIEIYSVTDSCAATALSANDTTTCTAAVAGQGKYNQAYTWSALAGSISSSGVYTAPATYPASGVDVITATSVGDTTKKAGFTISLAPSRITGVTASCPSVGLGQGQVMVCTAAVTGTGSFSNGYIWSTTGGTITPKGSLTAPTTGTSVTITATSVQDTTKSASVTLALSPVLTMGPVSSTVTGATATINWAINLPANSYIAYGPTPALQFNTGYNPSQTLKPSFTVTGLQPSTLYYVTAYSFINSQGVSSNYTFTTSNGSTAVTGVTVNCAATSLLTGASTGCAATVQGSGSYSSAVTWSTSLGSISSTGVLTAPLQLLASSITVTATSVTDPSKSGSVTIGLNPANAVTSVSIACQSTSITAGSTTTCVPTVTSTGTISTAVTLSASAGSITPSGVLTAPTTGTSVTVTATSVATPSKTASTVVALTPLPAITGVTVSCQATALNPGGTTACGATVAGTGSYTSNVTWSTSAGSITSTGAVTAPTSGTSFTVTATSTEDPNKRGVTTIAVNPAVTITNPVAVVTGNSITVSWTVNTPAHSFVQYGLAPAVSNETPYDPTSTTKPSYTLTGFPPSTKVYMILTSMADNQVVSLNFSAVTAAGSPTVSSVSVNCPSASLSLGTSEACTSAVAGTGSYSSAVTWSISAGSITSTGVLTAPTTGSSVAVKATSVQDPTKSAIATLSLTPLATVSGVRVLCPVDQLAPGASTTCNATVSGSGSYSSAVSWSASIGTVTPAGIVTAPAAGTSIVLTATSTQDPTKSASSTIAVTQILAILNPTFSGTSTTLVVSWTVTQSTWNGIHHDDGPGTLTYTTPYVKTPTTNPSFRFTDLKPGTTYTGTIFSTNAAGITVSKQVTYTTPLK